MSIEINFKELDAETSKKLQQFFFQQMQLGIKFWSKNETYVLEDKTEIKFKNDLFQRERKIGKEGLRYEIISNKDPLGEGGYGTVNKIKHTLAISEKEIILKKVGTNNRRRIVKIQEHRKSNNLEDLQNEYELANRAEHLHIKKPTRTSDLENASSYTVMMLLPGKEVIDVVNEDRVQTNILTTKQRFEISINLLRAVEKQVTSKGIIHRDLKPDNILLDLGKQIQVNIIDFGLAMDMDKISQKTRGSLLYLAPELLDDPQSASDKSDVFSIARILFLIWGGHNDTYDPDIYDNESDVYDLTTAQRIENLFTGIKDLGFGAQSQISSTLMEMLDTIPEFRCSLEDAIDVFTFLAENSEKHIIDPSTSCNFGKNNIAVDRNNSSEFFKQRNSFFKPYDSPSENTSDDNYISNEKISDESAEELQFDCY